MRCVRKPGVALKSSVCATSMAHASVSAVTLAGCPFGISAPCTRVKMRVPNGAVVCPSRSNAVPLVARNGQPNTRFNCLLSSSAMPDVDAAMICWPAQKNSSAGLVGNLYPFASDGGSLEIVVWLTL